MTVWGPLNSKRLERFFVPQDWTFVGDGLFLRAMAPILDSVAE